MKPYYQDDLATLYHGDCLAVMPVLPDASVDLIIADPPYFRVKAEWWDRQWDTAEDFLAWIGSLCQEWRRVLKPNGSLYCFASPKMAALVEVEIGKAFNVLNRITWKKEEGWVNRQCREEQRTFFPASEAIIFAEHCGADNMAKGEAGYAAKCDELRGFVFEPLRKYLRDEWERAGLHTDEANIACGTASMAARHYFTRSQWCLPTAQHYASLQRYANRNCNGSGSQYLRREYEDLRREYEDLRRPFFLTDGKQHADVWDFPTVADYPGKHPCEKPIPLLTHIIEASSRKGALVLDPTCGSGSTLISAREAGRRAIGIDVDKRWVERAARRLEQGVFAWEDGTS